MPNIVIREAVPDDAKLVAQFILDLAAHEKVLAETSVSVERLREQLGYRATPPLYCLIAEDNWAPVGFAAYYLAYSTNRTNWAVHLQDLFVREGHQRKGIGRALIRHLAMLTREGGREWVELEVLTNNPEALKFYNALGAAINSEADKLYFGEAALEALVK